MRFVAMATYGKARGASRRRSRLEFRKVTEKGGRSLPEN